MWCHFVVNRQKRLGNISSKRDANGSAGPLSRLLESDKHQNLARFCKDQLNIQKSIFQNSNTGYSCQAPRLVNKMPQ